MGLGSRLSIQAETRTAIIIKTYTHKKNSFWILSQKLLEAVRFNTPKHGSEGAEHYELQGFRRFSLT